MDTEKDYFHILVSIMEKKLSIMEKILVCTKEQELCAKQVKLDMDAFNVTMDTKEVLINQLNELDEGFEGVFNRVKDNMVINKARYSDEIKYLQKLITQTTDLSVEIKVNEERNREKLLMLFDGTKKEIRQFRQGRKTASNYYKSMSGGDVPESFFFNKVK